ncbi:gpW family protein [Methylosinus sp. Sm6]|uniref:gpW family protein n=1 Tax=Methylosinus sp. Sm6 TaxID=2866948 RepID=UPI001C99D0CF|nr:gpW family protein [Methylosinus sp. Sm6]MBY6239817.1 gpW family protein [Methylosinus sp. Sm6]
MTDLSSVDSATLTRWLDEARAAYHQLSIGRSVVELRHKDKTIAYRHADAERLIAYIARLEAALAGGGRPSGIGVIF